MDGEGLLTEGTKAGGGTGFDDAVDWVLGGGAEEEGPDGGWEPAFDLLAVSANDCIVTPRV